MAGDDTGKILKAIEEQNRLLRSLLAVTIDGYLRDHPEVANQRFKSIDQLLSEAGGLKNTDIGSLLGKTPQAVGQVLGRDRDI